MKKLQTIVRVLLGLLLLVSFVSYVFQLFPEPDFTGNAKLFHVGMQASGYLFILIKSIELLCAVAFASGRFVPLAAALLLPLSINILLFHAMLVPEGLPIAFILAVGNGVLLYVYRDHYKPIFSVKGYPM